jgi:hypothetical protein
MPNFLSSDFDEKTRTQWLLFSENEISAKKKLCTFRPLADKAILSNVFTTKGNRCIFPSKDHFGKMQESCFTIDHEVITSKFCSVSRPGEPMVYEGCSPDFIGKWSVWSDAACTRHW